MGIFLQKKTLSKNNKDKDGQFPLKVYGAQKTRRLLLAFAITGSNQKTYFPVRPILAKQTASTHVENLGITPVPSCPKSRVQGPLSTSDSSAVGQWIPGQSPGLEIRGKDADATATFCFLEQAGHLTFPT